MPADIRDVIDQGRGVTPADLVLRGGQVFDLITGDLDDTDIAICGDTIVGVGAGYEGREVIDVTGRILVPGFIDTHLHIESSLVTPLEFDRCVCPRGITTAICDPHEIANVAGPAGHPLLSGGVDPHDHGYPGAAVVLRALDRHGDLGRAP